MKKLPLFCTTFSKGRSVLTLDKSENPIPYNKPVSVFSIAKKHNLNKITVVDSSMSGFYQLAKIAKEEGIDFKFGLKLFCCDDINNKSEASLSSQHKIIIFIRGGQGYSDLCKLATLAQTAGFYYTPRIDYNNLKLLWSKDLLLAIPFYDSFLHKNLLYNGNCCINLPTKPILFLENNDLPFDEFLREEVNNFAKTKDCQTIEAQTVYYYNKDFFKSYLTYRCIDNRSTWAKPELSGFCSNSFNFESCLGRLK